MSEQENPLIALSNAMAGAVKSAGTSTILVNARRRLPATGVAYSAELILTADHVIEREEEIQIVLPDGSEASASLAGRDPGNDLALLRLDQSAAIPASLAEGAPRVGQLTLALGRPGRDGLQASLGIVSALGGPSRTRRGGLLESYIRTDAIPYPGFSGGPLIDAHGRLLGINTSGLGVGASVAIPHDTAWKVAAALAEGGSVKRGFLGIRSQPVEVPAEARRALGREQSQGLLVIDVEAGSPAASGGLMVGDILVGIEDQPVEDHDQLLGKLTGDVVGRETPLQVVRGGEPQTLQVTVGEREEAQPQGRFRRRRRFWHGR